MNLILTTPGDEIYTPSLNMVDAVEGLANYLLHIPGEREHPGTFFWPTLAQLVRLRRFAGTKWAEEEKNSENNIEIEPLNKDNTAEELEHADKDGEPDEKEHKAHAPEVQKKEESKQKAKDNS